MSEISNRFADGKQLIPYVMGGWPNKELCRETIKTFVRLGCRIVEIGIPYSDPLADGPTIQRASEASLARGTTTEDVFEIIRSVKEQSDISPVLMVYYNLIYRYGPERFAREAGAAGVDGVIVPDLTVEESGPWIKTAGDHGLDTVFLVAPTSSDSRLEKILSKTSGFVYAVSLTGVTGARRELPDDLKEFIARVKSKTSLPVAVGFGISRPEQAHEVARLADGVIIGSAIIDVIEKSPADRIIENIERFAGELLSAIQ